MHYESKGVNFFLPSELIQNANLIRETDRSDVSSLPPKSSDESQIYDRDKKKLLKFGGPRPSFLQFKSSCLCFQ